MSCLIGIWAFPRQRSGHGETGQDRGRSSCAGHPESHCRPEEECDWRIQSRIGETEMMGRGLESDTEAHNQAGHEDQRLQPLRRRQLSLQRRSKYPVENEGRDNELRQRVAKKPALGMVPVRRAPLTSRGSAGERARGWNSKHRNEAVDTEIAHGLKAHWVWH